MSIENMLKLITPEDYEEKLADAIVRSGGTEDASHCDHKRVEAGIYECFTPVTVVYYQREPDGLSLSKSITMQSRRTTRLIDPRDVNEDIVRSIRLEYVRRLADDWPDVGVAFVYKLNDLDDSVMHKHPSGKLCPVVRMCLVEGYLEHEE